MGEEAQIGATTKRRVCNSITILLSHIHAKQTRGANAVRVAMFAVMKFDNSDDTFTCRKVS